MMEADKIKIKFLGGAKTVTGSKTLIEAHGKRILIDCGLFQGIKEFRRLNWSPLLTDASKIDVVLLTHAHLDHCGYLPLLVKNGFKGTIYATHPTKEITEIILRDSAKIQEEDAHRANKYSYSRYSKAKPLYTLKEAKTVSEHFSTHAYNEWIFLAPTVKFQFLNAGHILGSSIIEIKIGSRVLIFSGDLGRKDPMLLYPPKKIKQADYLIVESTYGDRSHEGEAVMKKLSKIIQKTVKRGGILMIPTFSVERAQELMYLIYKLRQAPNFPSVPVYLDSPMGVNTTLIFQRYPNWQDLSKFDLTHMYDDIRFVNNYEESKAIVSDKKPKIVLAGSGMLQGGRILHYLNNHGNDPKNTLLFVGFQAEGTRGRAILNGSESVKFFGTYHPISCEIASISSLSAHGDRYEMLNWLKNLQQPPKKIFLNHGEPHQLDAFRVLIETELGWETIIPNLGESFILK